MSAVVSQENPSEDGWMDGWDGMGWDEPGWNGCMDGRAGSIFQSAQQQSSCPMLSPRRLLRGFIRIKDPERILKGP